MQNNCCLYGGNKEMIVKKTVANYSDLSLPVFRRLNHTPTTLFSCYIAWPVLVSVTYVYMIE
jgi:hypothetical protein